MASRAPTHHFRSSTNCYKLSGIVCTCQFSEPMNAGRVLHSSKPLRYSFRRVASCGLGAALVPGRTLNSALPNRSRACNSLSSSPAGPLISRFPRIEWKNHNLLILLTLFCNLSSLQTASTWHVATGNQGMSCSQQLRSRGLPLHQVECGIFRVSAFNSPTTDHRLSLE